MLRGNLIIEVPNVIFPDSTLVQLTGYLVCDKCI